MTERIGRLMISMVVGVVVFRKLGVERLGAFSYALAMMGLFSPLSTAGLGENLVRRMVGERTCVGTVLGTAFMIRLAGSMLGFALGLTAYYVLPNHTNASVFDVTIAGLMLWSAPLLVLDPFFQSLSRSRVVTVCGLAAGVVAACVKMGGVALDAPISFFLFANALDALLLGAGLLSVYLAITRAGAWHLDVAVGRALLAEAIPSILAGFAIFIYDQSDLILLGMLSQEREVGLYTAAVRVSSIWRFVPFAILTSAAPLLYRAQQRSDTEYAEALLQTTSLVMATSYCFIVPIALFPAEILGLLFGESYVSAAPALRVHIFSNLFCVLGVAQSTWLIGRGLLWAGLRNTIIGAVVNVALNLVIIPRYGAVGAAATTVLATCVATIPLNAIFKDTRRLAGIQVKSFALAGMRDLIGRIRHMAGSL
jgi:PST family polysaccharide transporter